MYLVAITALIGLFPAAIGVWCLIDPRSFAESVGFPAHEHFAHDVGAFQYGRTMHAELIPSPSSGLAHTRPEGR